MLHCRQGLFWTFVGCDYRTRFSVLSFFPENMPYKTHPRPQCLEWPLAGQLEQVQSKNCYFMFNYTFSVFCFCFSSKKLCFYHFHLFFWWNIKVPQQNINQSETTIGDKKLSMELYAVLHATLVIHQRL